jgi:hypothetical protein
LTRLISRWEMPYPWRTSRLTPIPLNPKQLRLTKTPLNIRR